MQHTPKAFRVITPLLALGLSIAFAAGISGSSSLNDPLYPWMGNGGYDAKHYTIDLRVPADHKTVEGMTVMEATATEDLSSFNLDLGSLQVKSVLVNGARANFNHDDPELTITPSETISKGSSFRVQVVYMGTPGSKARPDEFGGWQITPTGLTAFAQPTSLLQWAAVNDHPADKATFTFRLTAPANEQAIANGIFVTRRENNDGTATSFYKISEPTTSYMPVLAFGQYKLVEGGTVNGGLLGQVRIRNYLAPGTASYYDSSFAKAGDMIRFFGEKLGAYPFREYGIITHDVEASFALENQTLSSFPAKFEGFGEMPAEEASAVIEEIYAHELAHQWFGALVSYQDHSQIFIHEGFAEFLGRFWSQHSNGRKLEEVTKGDYGFMLYAKEGGYFQFSKADYVNTLKGPGFKIKPDFVFDAAKVGQALDLIFSGTLPAASRASIIEKATSEANGGLNIEQLTNEIAQLPFTKIAVTRRINREVRRLADPSLESVKASPVPGTIKAGDNPFDGNVYNRGSATLYALYLKVGEDTFFKILRTYLERHHFANATNEDFLRVVAELGGADARALTERWLFDERVPDFPELGVKAEDFKLGADFK
jgi:aminopeptidase N